MFPLLNPGVRCLQGRSWTLSSAVYTAACQFVLFHTAESCTIQIDSSARPYRRILGFYGMGVRRLGVCHWSSGYRRYDRWKVREGGKKKNPKKSGFFIKNVYSAVKRLCLCFVKHILLVSKPNTVTAKFWINIIPFYHPRQRSLQKGHPRFFSGLTWHFVFSCISVRISYLICWSHISVNALLPRQGLTHQNGHPFLKLKWAHLTFRFFLY